jgi:hypothetical protein
MTVNETLHRLLKLTNVFIDHRHYLRCLQGLFFSTLSADWGFESSTVYGIFNQILIRIDEDLIKDNSIQREIPEKLTVEP